MLVRPDDGAIDEVERPIQLTHGLSVLLQDRQEVWEDPGPLPAVEAACDGTPRTIPFR